MNRMHSTLGVLPPTSLRDIIALILILNYLPPYVNSIILMLYILSGSTKFISGKLFIKYITLRNKHIDDSFYYLNSNLNYYKVLTSFFQMLVINSFILLFIKCIFPEFLLRNIDLLAKTILSSELIGSSSNTLTSIITSSSSDTSTDSSSSNKNHHHYLNGGPNTHNTSHNNNSIGNNQPQFNDHIKKSTNELLNNNFLKILFCFSMILIIKTINNNINFSLIFKFLMSQDFGSILSQKIFNKNVFHINEPNYNSVYDHQNHHINMFPSAGGSENYNYNYNHYASTTANGFQLHQSNNGFNVSSILLFFYYELCINVITIKFNPVFSIIGLKRLSNNLDQLNNLNPNIPIDFKRNLKFKDSKDDSKFNDNEPSSVPTISLKTNSTNNNFNNKSSKSVDISLPKAISNSKINFKSSNSISSKNFEIFCLKLFTNKKQQASSSFNGHSNGTANTGSNTNGNQFRLSKNSTLIIDKNLSIIQPIWSLLAVLKVITRNSSLFQGKFSYHKKNLDEYSLDVSRGNKLIVSTKYIDDHKIMLKVFNDDETLLSNLKVTINGVDWEYFLTSGKYLLIYALSPNFQYEIEIKNKAADNEVLNNLILNTVSSSNEVPLKESLSVNPLLTLKTSLKSTLEILDQIKIGLKDFKREENKKLSEVKKSNELLQEKIYKSSNNDEHNLKKIKGLKQSINQFEIEIDHLQQELNIISNNNENLHESDYRKEIDEVKEFFEDYNVSMNKFKVQLKEVEDLKSQHLTKIDKLINKQKDIEAEINHFLNETENLKTVILTKLQRKSKKINENFDTILPNVKQATLELNKELESINHKPL